jgi:hypothetical protein
MTELPVAAIHDKAPYMKNRRRILALQNAYAGQQGVILCPGPSVEKVDLSLLADHPCVMGINGVFLLRNRFKFYFCSSPNFFIPNVARIAAVDAELVFLSSFVRQDVENLPAELQDTAVFLDVDQTQLDARRPGGEFHFDLTRTLAWGPTVLLDIALPALLWMGFSEIVLLGADYPRSAYRRFYTGRSDALCTLSESNHEFEMSMAHCRFDQVLRLVLALPTPVRIINCSPNSELMQFERRLLEEVLDPQHIRRSPVA